MISVPLGTTGRPEVAEVPPILHYGTYDPHTALCGARLKGVDVPGASATCSVCLELSERGITRVDLLLDGIDRTLGGWGHE